MSTQSQQLFDSLSTLENAIERAKGAVAVRGVNAAQMISRLDCYLEVVRRQKILAQALIAASKREEWEQVNRLGELIRGSSTLIQLEAQSFIEELIRGKPKIDSYQA